MIRKIKVEVNDTEKIIEYEGETEMEIAKQIQADENELLYYMQTGDEAGSKCFCFRGYMIKKANILTARFTDPDF